MYKTILVSGAVLAMTAIILGALGAHYLKSIWAPDVLASFETGVRYQFYHGLALIMLGLYAHLFQRKSGWVFPLMLTGVSCFSFSIYLLCWLKSNGTIGLSGLGILTPVGGVLMIIGWFLWIADMFKLSSH